MKKWICALVLGLATNTYGHDEGHGPKLSDTGKYGGLVSGVVLKSDTEKGASAALIHKAELVRSADGTVRVYFYDEKMAPRDLKSFENKGSVSVIFKMKGKSKESKFNLEKQGNLFIGKMSKPEGKPYNLDVIVTENGRELLAAFDNLD